MEKLELAASVGEMGLGQDKIDKNISAGGTLVKTMVIFAFLKNFNFKIQNIKQSIESECCDIENLLQEGHKRYCSDWDHC